MNKRGRLWEQDAEGSNPFTPTNINCEIAFVSEGASVTSGGETSVFAREPKLL